METLMDIEISRKIPSLGSIVQKGKIIIDEDGWCEGILLNPYSKHCVDLLYTEDRFISGAYKFTFGVYYPEKVIELYESSPMDASKILVFHGEMAEEGYDGDLTTIIVNTEIPSDGFHITTQYVESNRRNIEEEIKELKEQIQIYKQGIMDGTFKRLYDNSISIKNIMCQTILRNSKGREFTAEEEQQIMEACRFANAKANEEPVKRLLKMLQGAPIVCDDDDSFS